MPRPPGGATASRFAIHLSAVVLLAACRTQPPAGTLQAALDRQLAENAEDHGIAGQAVLILRNGKTVYRGSHGLADRERNVAVRPDHIFPVFSVSKLFASVLVMQLVERGELDLTAPASRYLPDLPERWRSITVDELLNHVSGLPDYWGTDLTTFVLPPTREAIFRDLAGRPMQFTTGTSTRYNQTNFIVLGAMLEALYRKSYRQIVTERIVDPLALRHTYFGERHVPAKEVVAGYRGVDGELVADFDIDWTEYAIVHAELYTTVDDLALFLNALCSGRLLEPETLLRLWKPHRRRDDSHSIFAAGWEYGTTGSYRYVGHEGGGKVRVSLLFRDSLADDTYAYIYATNGSAENVWTSKLVDSLMDVVSRYDQVRRVNVSTRPQLVEAALDAFRADPETTGGEQVTAVPSAWMTASTELRCAIEDANVPARLEPGHLDPTVPVHVGDLDRGELAAREPPTPAEVACWVQLLTVDDDDAATMVATPRSHFA